MEDYKELKQFFENGGLDGDLDPVRYTDGELEHIMQLSLKEWDRQHNVGFHNYRIHHECGDREKAFHDHWYRENDQNPGLNYGRGVLQNLCYRGDKCIHQVTPMERTVTATAIQWLGSNIGFSFLERVLDDCGYKIVKNE